MLAKDSGFDCDRSEQVSMDIHFTSLSFRQKLISFYHFSNPTTNSCIIDFFSFYRVHKEEKSDEFPFTGKMKKFSNLIDFRSCKITLDGRFLIEKLEKKNY